MLIKIITLILLATILVIVAQYNKQIKVNKKLSVSRFKLCHSSKPVKQVGLTRDTMYSAVAKYMEEIMNVSNPQNHSVYCYRWCGTTR